MFRLATGVALLALVIAVAPRLGEAEPPADADPALRPWFESLKQPGTGVSCCSISDCRPVQYRLVPEGYEALVGSLWVHVPDDRVPAQSEEPGGARGPLPLAGQREDLLFRAGAGDLTVASRFPSRPLPRHTMARHRQLRGGRAYAGYQTDRCYPGAGSADEPLLSCAATMFICAA